MVVVLLCQFRIRPVELAFLAIVEVPTRADRWKYVRKLPNGPRDAKDGRASLPTTNRTDGDFGIHPGERVDGAHLHGGARGQPANSGLFHRPLLRLDDVDDGGVWGHHAPNVRGTIGRRRKHTRGRGHHPGAGGRSGASVFGFPERKINRQTKTRCKCKDEDVRVVRCWTA